MVIPLLIVLISILCGLYFIYWLVTYSPPDDML
jgi:hypothetical protein